MNFYSIFGFTVQSEEDLEAPLLDCRTTDISFERRNEPVSPSMPFAQSVNELSWNESECLWSGGGAGPSFYVADGNLIYAWHYGRRITPALRDLALACAFVQRGDIALHASSASWGSRADLFVGLTGAGKSTTAAAVSLLGGAEHLADDICRLSIEENGVCISKGAGEACLEESVFRILSSASSFQDPGPSGHPEQKRRRRISASILSAPVPVRRIFMLTPGNSLSITPLNAKEAFESLLPSVLLFPLLQSLFPGKHMEAAGMLISQAEVYSLEHTGNPADLPSMVAKLEPGRT